jgi:signal transduction histidine kinase
MQDIDRQPLLCIRIRNIEGGPVLTEFIDNGRGLPDDGVDRIFDAFVSTKENGMGIGLAISRSIVEAHDGEVFAANNPGVRSYAQSAAQRFKRQPSLDLSPLF